MVTLSKELVLLGDSIIDNKTYVLDGEMSVLEHIQSKTDTKTVQLALDGATTDDVLDNQLNNISSEASHIVLSVGGNDLLNEIGFLMEDFKYTPNQVLERCYSLIAPISKKYESMTFNEMVPLFALPAVPITKSNLFLRKLDTVS